MVDFGRTAADYARHRHGFPPKFFERLDARGLLPKRARALDLGTGTGTLARGIAHRGLDVVGIDQAAPLLAQARRLAIEEGLTITFIEARAEATGLNTGDFSLITAGQCWHWFDRTVVMPECVRLLATGGHLVIAHLDWLPFTGNIVELTINTIHEFGARFPPKLDHAREGIYPGWTREAYEAGLRGIETFSFDVELPYSKEDWRGRVRASAAIGATLEPPRIAAFDARMAAALEPWPEVLSVPHRVWAMTARKDGEP